MSLTAQRLKRWIGRLQGRPVDWGGQAFRGDLAAIREQGRRLETLDDAGFAEEMRRCREAVRPMLAVDGLHGSTEQSRARRAAVQRCFALSVDACRRALGMRPYDSQVLAGLALDAGKMVEMQTGEGKTLAAVAPAFVGALTEKGVHVLTFNDYLAGRDAEWMGPAYRMLGVDVASVREGMESAPRRAAYSADVTYATAREAGFDLLRDSLARTTAGPVHRDFGLAIVDEADSILIDEARIPLVIAGREPGGEGRPDGFAAVAAGLPDDCYVIDEGARNVSLSESGYARLEQELDCGPLVDPDNLEILTGIHCALHARLLLHRDVDYIVRDGEIALVDAHTGRVAEKRRLPDDLHAAVQAKEQLVGGQRGAVLGSLTLAHFLSGYRRLAGMTGTAQTSAEEFREFYGLETVVIEPHRPSKRIDHPDRIYTAAGAKRRALVREIESEHRRGRPVLVGTASVAESESLAGQLAEAGVPCNVLNARRDAEEARIVAEAGALGAVTISTNMAGRGTDIRLGGLDESQRDAVVDLGGLLVLGAARHESRRIDDQLRGRAGRQGDPGETRFSISLDDPLLTRYGIEQMVPESRWPEPSEHPVEDPVVAFEARRAQRIVEGENLEVRRTLGRYSGTVEQQHDQLKLRRERCLAASPRSIVDQAFVDQAWIASQGAALRSAVAEALDAHPERSDDVRQIVLGHHDRTWREHLAHVGELRQTIHLQSVARLDPLAVFQKEIIDAWGERQKQLDEGIAASLERWASDPDRYAPQQQGLGAPAATWTYLITDDPFRHQLLGELSGTAKGLGIIAIFPVVFAWWIYSRFFWKRRPAKDRRWDRG